METRPLGRSGLQVSEIALGSWLTFGSSVAADATRQLTRAAYDMGVNFFDTADVYANGKAEEVLGEALHEIPRHTFVLATKCFFPMSERPNDRGLSRKHIVESVEGSLRRLGTDYLDLHQCHRMDHAVPLEETVRAYEDLIRQGKILYWGVSEWSFFDVRRYVHARIAHNETFNLQRLCRLCLLSKHNNFNALLFLCCANSDLNSFCHNN